MRQILKKYGKTVLQALLIAILGGGGGVASYQFMEGRIIATDEPAQTIDEWAVWYRVHSNTLTDRYIDLVIVRGTEPTPESFDSLGRTISLPDTYSYEKFLHAEHVGTVEVPPIEPIETDTI